MSSAEDLRKYLRETGFALCKEVAVRDGNHIYTVINAHYTGVVEPEMPGVDYIGKLDMKDSEETRGYIERQLRHVNNCLFGQLHRGNEVEIARLQAEVNALQAYLLQEKENEKR